MKTASPFRLMFIAFIAGSIFCGTAFADEVTDSINAALESYKKGNHSEAVNNLNFASQKIAQLKSDKLKAFIPKALDGWKGEEPTSQAAGSGMFGGGISAEGKYTKKGSNLSVKIATDSPLLQGIMMMMSNPMFAANDGGKVEKINGQTAMVKYNSASKDGNINIVVAGKMLVTVEGNDVTQDELVAYAKAVNYDQLAAMP